MKPIQPIFYLSILISIIAVLVSIFTLIKKVSPSERDLDLCKEYEMRGYLAPGGCVCAQKLFPVFSESYDWMDACRIVER